MTDGHTGAGASAGDVVPAGCEVIEVRVGELRQLFNAIDPSPFHDRDLDPKAESFIVGWGSDVPPKAPLALVVHLDRQAGADHESAALRDAIHEFFTRRARETTRRLRDLFHRGRLSLVIALAFLAVALAIGEQVARHFPDSRVAGLVREGVLIVGWVAMWRPIEIFLYDWWPIRAERRPVRTPGGDARADRVSKRRADGRMAQRLAGHVRRHRYAVRRSRPQVSRPTIINNQRARSHMTA